MSVICFYFQTTTSQHSATFGNIRRQDQSLPCYGAVSCMHLENYFNCQLRHNAKKNLTLLLFFKTIRS